MDVNTIIESGGLLVVALVIFAESGMLLGFFLPGDTLLIAAGIFAAQGKLSIGLTIAVIALAAIVGDNTGYAIGRYAGKRMFRKKDGILFRQEYLERSEKFYERFGAKTMLVGHFLPIVRTFAPMVAGIGKMSHWQFFIYDAIGDIAWAFITTMLGYWFGSKIPNLDHYLLPAFAIVVVLCFAPLFWHLFADPKARKKLLAIVRRKKTDSSDDEA